MSLSRASLRTRLLLLVGAAYLPAVALTLATIHKDREEALSEVREKLSKLLGTAAAENNLVLNTGQRAVRTWAQTPEIIYGDRETCEATIARLSRFSPSVVFISRINVNGVVDCGLPLPANNGTLTQDNPFVTQLRAADTAVVVGYLPARADSVPALPFLIALRDSTGAYRGLLGVGYRLSWFADLASSTDLPDDATVSLIDSTGLLYASLPEKSNTIGQIQPGLNTLIARDLSDSGVLFRRTGPSGEMQLVAHHRLGSAPNSFMRLRLIMPSDVAYAAPMDRARWRVLFLLIAGTAALAITWFGSGWLIVRDVKSVLSATRRLGEGDLSARTGVDSTAGEIGQLASAFDTMASQLEVRQDRLRQAERMESLGRLAGGIAHDFNNLLTAIVGSADLALNELPPGHAVREELEMIKTSATRSGSLTRQLLDFSRRTPVGLEPQRLDAIVQNAVALLMRVMPASVSVRVRTLSRKLVRIDSGRVEQAIINLAVNARDAMPDGGKLSIDLDDVDISEQTTLDGPPAGSWVRLRIHDTGHGMSPEILKHVFEPFYTTKQVGQGTGLGLTMVYGTVEAHAGHMLMHSSPGEGTTVTIWFPEALATANAETTSQPPVNEINTNARVLVVEDQPEVQAMLRRILKRKGFEVITASNGAEALELFNTTHQPIDILITDYDMPQLRGDTLALAARKKNPNLPVILISGFTSRGWPEELLSSKYTIVLNKPFAAQELLTAVFSVGNATPPSGTPIANPAIQSNESNGGGNGGTHIST